MENEEVEEMSEGVETMDNSESLTLEADEDTNIVTTFLDNFSKNF